ncbi:transcription factor CSA [Brachypodium distachyon]|uniref:Uncharacterized protein n=1 Tax=Brachypodium distachyon TaxID=15368 RepID=I1IMN8_BRADI|nr:transcription factor CSA [Brachypodium distachyon]KQJ89007.1 hypothetical protein BRADI_4g22730v3 [Brachypodium distachyon]|eukprot:XP_003576185.1 transcription factor CSA [Brachypodium distachyon]
MASSSTTNTSDGGGVKPSSCPRGHWRPGEDEKLRQLVEKYGPQNWNSIAEKLEGRSGKSCRLRWFNQLDPRINKRPFTEEEEERLLAAHRVHGNKWALIARHFPGRTDNAVKNHWHVVRARRSRERCRLLAKASASASSSTLIFPPYYNSYSSSQIDFSSFKPTATASGFFFGSSSQYSLPVGPAAAATPLLFSASSAAAGVGKSLLVSPRYRSYDQREPAAMSIAFASPAASREALAMDGSDHSRPRFRKEYYGRVEGSGGEPVKASGVGDKPPAFIDFLGVGVSS